MEIRIQDILYHCNRRDFETIESLANQKLVDLNNYQRVKDNIFRILRNIENLYVMKFPIEDPKLHAFTMQRGDKKIIFINTAHPLDLQIFAAAHELYHVFFDPDFWAQKGGEVLTDLESGFSNPKEYNEMMANCFAACFLVSKKHLLEEIAWQNLHSRRIGPLDIVKLMDAFAVPYRAMVLRLLEIGFIQPDQAQSLLAISDRHPSEGVQQIIKKTRFAVDWQVQTRDTEYGHLISSLFDNYENGSSPIPS